MRRRAPVTRRLAWLLVGLVVAALLAELAVRVRLYVQTGAWGVAHTYVEHESSGLMIPTPGRVTGMLAIDSRGFRSPELDVPKPAGRVRLAFLGGSTTFCAEVAGNENTWPHLVFEGLRAAHPEVSLDYVNASAGGYATDSLLVDLEKRVLPLEPDVIFVYEATNDLTKDTRAIAEAQGLYTGQGEVEDWLTRHSLAWLLLKKNIAYRARVREDALSRGPLVFDPTELAREAFRDRLRVLITRAQEIAPVVVLLTFTQRTRERQSAAELLAASSSSLYYMPYLSPEQIRDSFAAYNSVIREVALEQHVLLVDGEDEIPADSQHFTDSVHFTAEGCRAMARRVLTRIDGLLDSH